MTPHLWDVSHSLPPQPPTCPNQMTMPTSLCTWTVKGRWAPAAPRSPSAPPSLWRTWWRWRRGVRRMGLGRTCWWSSPELSSCRSVSQLSAAREHGHVFHRSRMLSFLAVSRGILCCKESQALFFLIPVLLVCLVCHALFFLIGYV